MADNSRRDAIEAALNESEIEDVVEEVTEEVEVESAEEVEEIEEEESGRDEKGRFKSKATESEEEAEDEPEPTEEVAEAVEGDIERVEATHERKYPSSWKKEPNLINTYADLPDSVIEQIEKRENDFHNGIADYKERAQVADRFNQAISPYMATIQQLGVAPEVAVQKLLGADHGLRYGTPEQKMSQLQSLAQSY